MNVIMIGAGNVATHIALRLKEKGHTPIQVWSRTKESAKTLAEQTGSRPVTSIDDIRTDADIYIISVKDDALQDVAKQLGEKPINGIVIHTAGSMAMDVLEGSCKHYGVLYPMQTFSKAKTVDFGHIPCTM